jgi:hypothetical protein
VQSEAWLQPVDELLPLLLQYVISHLSWTHAQLAGALVPFAHSSTLRGKKPVQSEAAEHAWVLSSCCPVAKPVGAELHARPERSVSAAVR